MNRVGGASQQDQKVSSTPNSPRLWRKINDNGPTTISNVEYLLQGWVTERLRCKSEAFCCMVNSIGAKQPLRLADRADGTLNTQNVAKTIVMPIGINHLDHCSR